MCTVEIQISGKSDFCLHNSIAAQLLARKLALATSYVSNDLKVLLSCPNNFVLFYGDQVWQALAFLHGATFQTSVLYKLFSI